MFMFYINVFGFKKSKLKNTNFWSKGGLQQNGFFMNLCFAKCEKLSFFLPFVWPILVAVQNTMKIGIQHIFKSKKKQKNTILRCYCLGQLGVIIWAKLKNGQLGLDNKHLRAQWIFQKK